MLRLLKVFLPLHALAYDHASGGGPGTMQTRPLGGRACWHLYSVGCAFGDMAATSHTGHEPSQCIGRVSFLGLATRRGACGRTQLFCVARHIGAAALWLSSILGL